MLSVTKLDIYAECRYAKCRYAECRGANVLALLSNTRLEGVQWGLAPHPLPQILD
jgi:hypothetical protein